MHAGSETAEAQALSLPCLTLNKENENGVIVLQSTWPMLVKFLSHGTECRFVLLQQRLSR